MVRIHPDPPGQKTDDDGRRKKRGGWKVSLAPDRSSVLRAENGAVAQLGEHLLCKQGVVGSIPISSTTRQSKTAVSQAPRRAEARDKRRAFTSDLGIGTECCSVVL